MNHLETLVSSLDILVQLTSVPPCRRPQSFIYTDFIFKPYGFKSPPSSKGALHSDKKNVKRGEVKIRRRLFHENFMSGEDLEED